jgi:hypothetical protein
VKVSDWKMSSIAIIWPGRKVTKRKRESGPEGKRPGKGGGKSEMRMRRVRRMKG